MLIYAFYEVKLIFSIIYLFDKRSEGMYHHFMEIRGLKYFWAVAREGSVTKAANYFHLTQPTLSRQLQDLEIYLKADVLLLIELNQV